MVFNSNDTTVGINIYLDKDLITNMDEENLIRRIQSGEKDEFRHLVQNYKNLVFSMILRQVGDYTLSEELSQEVFIKAYLNLKKFQHKSSFSTWLTRIALNHVSTYFSSKRYKLQKITEAYDYKNHETTTDDSSRENEIKHEQQLESFRQAVAKLKNIFRDVIVLCSLEGKSYEEAAGILGVPVGTVRSRLNKARLLIKQSIES